MKKQVLKFPKKVKMIPMNKLLKKADATFSLWIRNRDGNKCVLSKVDARCGGYIQNGHLIKRGKKSVRFSEVNCHAQCASHNYLHNIYPEIYTNWFIQKYGKDKYHYLVLASYAIAKWNREGLNKIIEKYKL